MKNMKIGSGTLAIGLIALGVLLLLQVSGILSYQALKYYGPLLLILFGIEIILGYFRQSDGEDRSVKFNVGAVIVLAIILMLSTVQSTIPQFLVWQPKYLSPVSDQIQINSEIKTIVIQIPDGKINIIGVTGQQLSYTGALKTAASSQEEADQKIMENWRVHQKGDTLEMILELPVQFNLIDFSVVSPHLDVEVPQSLMTNVKTKNSSIHVENMIADVSMQTSNGKMNVDSISGNVDIKTSNGKITAKDINGNLIANTSNGAITISNILGTVTATSSNGAIDASSEIHGHWNLKTSNGRITLNVSEQTNASVQASTSNGSFGGNVIWPGDDKQRRSVTLGAGTYNIVLKTSNGNVNLNNK